MDASRDRIRVSQLRNVITTLRGERKIRFRDFSRFDTPVCNRPASGSRALEPTPRTQKPAGNEKREPDVDDPRPSRRISPSKWYVCKHCLASCLRQHGSRCCKGYAEKGQSVKNRTHRGGSAGFGVLFNIH